MDVLRIYNKNGKRVELVLDQDAYHEGAGADTIPYNGEINNVHNIQEAIDFVYGWAVDANNVKDIVEDADYMTKEQVSRLISQALVQAGLIQRGEKV